MESSILNMVQNVGTPRTYEPAEKVFIEGTPGTTIYVDLDGNIEIQVGDMLWLVFKATGIGFFLFGTRFLVYFVVARVLNIRRITNFHYFKNLQTNFQSISNSPYS